MRIAEGTCSGAAVHLIPHLPPRLPPKIRMPLVSRQGYVISPDFPLELTGFFPGKHLIHFLVLKMKDFRNFILDNCILDFDAEQVYLNPQVTNLKTRKLQQTLNSKP